MGEGRNGETQCRLYAALGQHPNNVMSQTEDINTLQRRHIWYNICMFQTPNLACGGPVNCDVTFEGKCCAMILIYGHI